MKKSVEIIIEILITALGIYLVCKSKSTLSGLCWFIIFFTSDGFFYSSSKKNRIDKRAKSKDYDSSNTVNRYKSNEANNQVVYRPSITLPHPGKNYTNNSVNNCCLASVVFVKGGQEYDFICKTTVHVGETVVIPNPSSFVTATVSRVQWKTLAELKRPYNEYPVIEKVYRKAQSSYTNSRTNISERTSTTEQTSSTVNASVAAQPKQEYKGQKQRQTYKKDSIQSRIINEIRSHNGIKAREIADILGITKKEVNHYLYSELNSLCWSDSEYRWYMQKK